MTAPREFNDWLRQAEFHCLQLEKSLALASDKAPSTGLERFTSRQSDNVRTLRRVLPSVREAARRS